LDIKKEQNRASLIHASQPQASMRRCWRAQRSTGSRRLNINSLEEFRPEVQNSVESCVPRLLLVKNTPLLSKGPVHIANCRLATSTRCYPIDDQRTKE